MITGPEVVAVLRAVYGPIRDQLRSNKLSLVFSEQPPYTHPDPRYPGKAWLRVGLRGSRTVPRDAKVLVTNIQPTPTEYPHFHADYPYSLAKSRHKDDREILFELGETWISSDNAVIFSGLQPGPRGDFDTFRVQPGEIWDVALLGLAADAKRVEAWVTMVAFDGRLKVRRLSHKPVGL